MERLTIRTNEASISFECESVGDIVRRLAAIEDILGDEYELDDIAPVRHGRWIDEIENPVPWDECNSKCPSHSAYCSECGEWLTASDEYPVTGLYCPNCGALMDKEDDNE